MLSKVAELRTATGAVWDVRGMGRCLSLLHWEWRLRSTRRTFAYVAPRTIRDVSQQIRRRERSRTRLRDYKSFYRRHCIECFSQVEVQDITNTYLVKFQDHLYKKKLSHSTIRHVMLFARKVLVKSIKMGIVRSVPGIPRRPVRPFSI